jgi:hypothetical protein
LISLKNDKEMEDDEGFDEDILRENTPKHKT